MEWLYRLAGGCAAVLGLWAITLIPPVKRRLRSWRARGLTELFERQRAALQEEFLQQGSGSGKPRGLRWVSCEWGTDFLLVRDLSCNGYVGMKAVAIQFAAIEGEDMEDVPAVALAKDAAAVFFFEAGAWHTGGKAVFNLSPSEVLERHPKLYEKLHEL